MKQRGERCSPFSFVGPKRFTPSPVKADLSDWPSDLLPDVVALLVDEKRWVGLAEFVALFSRSEFKVMLCNVLFMLGGNTFSILSYCSTVSSRSEAFDGLASKQLISRAQVFFFPVQVT